MPKRRNLIQMIVGTEWLIEAEGCDAEKLRDVESLRAVFRLIIADLDLKTVGKEIWHQFAGEKGVTGLIALTESHLACHTYPEHRIATFNLYCCKNRPEWNWKETLREMLGAENVRVRRINRGDFQSRLRSPKSKIQNPKSKVVGGEA